ncbi:Cystathionine beta lyase protein [Candidatus Micropelagos thuwalensis]|uniref:Cystathionine beta lyase protein n=1 Tax=Candidatus Micropelagius thuwalensis TaxID=1397666 RepID=U2XQR8_9PROT|nr:SPOR domain-containing protein [Candidatus Micropelagos thuwalensis]ERL47472.1 Cystathionine beta lyase protein [Candidatus Micropelagos thuwalensis]
MSPTKPPSGPPNDPFTDPLSGSGTETLSAGDNFTPLSSQMTNQNADIGIGKPPPDASYYDYNDGGSNLPIILMGIGAVLITAMIAGLVYLAYMKGLEDGQSSMPPLILAEEAPVKTPPPDEITARRPEEGGLNIYRQLEVEDVDASTQENIPSEALSEPIDDIPAIKEDSMEGNGGIESLMAEVMEVETQTFDNAAAENPEALEGETLEKTSIEESQSEENLIPLASPKSKNKTEITPEIVSEVSTNIAPLVIENNYMVQLISVRTPAEASKEFTRISNKNKSIIGNREPLVKEVDLGERGKFYRVNIHGFVSLDAANEFCSALKENGQDCLVVKVPQ